MPSLCSLVSIPLVVNGGRFLLVLYILRPCCSKLWLLMVRTVRDTHTQPLGDVICHRSKVQCLSQLQACHILHMIQMTGKSPAILQRGALPLRLVHKLVQVTAAAIEAKLKPNTRKFYQTNFYQTKLVVEYT